MTKGAERTRWKIRSDRLVDETPQVRLSIASLELASGLTFEQYVMRLPRCAMTVVLDDAAERILLIWRHRFIIDRWLWELPGGYIDPGEDGIAAAAREVEEETGYRPRSIEPILTFQPMAGSADSAHELFLGLTASWHRPRKRRRDPQRQRRTGRCCRRHRGLSTGCHVVPSLWAICVRDGTSSEPTPHTSALLMACTPTRSVNMAPGDGTPGIGHGQILRSPEGPILVQAGREYVPGRNFLTFLAPHTYSSHTPTAR